LGSLNIELTIAPVEATMVMCTNNLNFDIDLKEAFAERVDLDETGRTVESTELGDQTNVTLRDGFIGVRAADAAGKGAHGSNT
jgi:hypothetical protein